MRLNLLRKWSGAAALAAALTLSPAARAKDAPEWSFKATIIEACSCPMFCQCYFNDEPASHGNHGNGGGYCRFNNAFRVDKGQYGDVKLDGAKFWLAGDLGHDFSKMEFEWAELTFDKEVGDKQKEAIREILTHVYPAKWGSFTEAQPAEMEWKAGRDKSEARLNKGKTAEVVLKRNIGFDPEKPIVIQNLKYWGVPRNEGFVMMGNEIEAYRAGRKPFEFKNSNGFMITIDMNSKDVKPKP